MQRAVESGGLDVLGLSSLVIRHVRVTGHVLSPLTAGLPLSTAGVHWVARGA